MNIMTVESLNTPPEASLHHASSSDIEQAQTSLEASGKLNKVHRLLE